MSSNLTRQDRYVFALEAAKKGSTIDVARRARVQPRTVDRWINDFNIPRDATSAEYDRIEGAQRDGILREVVGLTDAVPSDAEHVLDGAQAWATRTIDLHQAWVDQGEHDEDGDWQLNEAQGLWKAILHAEDQNNPDSPYNQLLDSWVNMWAIDIESEARISIGDEEFPESPEGYSGTREQWWDQVSTAAVTELIAHRWESIKD